MPILLKAGFFVHLNLKQKGIVLMRIKVKQTYEDLASKIREEIKSDKKELDRLELKIEQRHTDRLKNS